MREIKFRAWHTELKKMFSAEEMGEDELTLAVDGRGFVNVHSASTRLSEYAGGKMISLQFTGLLDKNGKEIYEGDIVKKENEKFIVCFYNGCWCQIDEIVYKDKEEEWFHSYWCEELFPWLSGNDKEIIGNIYENPELLKEEVATADGKQSIGV